MMLGKHNNWITAFTKCAGFFLYTCFKISKSLSLRWQSFQTLFFFKFKQEFEIATISRTLTLCVFAKLHLTHFFSASAAVWAKVREWKEYRCNRPSTLPQLISSPLHTWKDWSVRATVNGGDIIHLSSQFEPLFLSGIEARGVERSQWRVLNM